MDVCQVYMLACPACKTFPFESNSKRSGNQAEGRQVIPFLSSQTLGCRYVTQASPGDEGAKSDCWLWLWVDYPENQGQVATGSSFNSSFPSLLFLWHFLYNLLPSILWLLPNF